MKNRIEKRKIKTAMIDRVERYQRLINEIKSFSFKDRLIVAFWIVKGNKRRK